MAEGTGRITITTSVDRQALVWLDDQMSKIKGQFAMTGAIAKTLGDQMTAAFNYARSAVVDAAGALERWWRASEESVATTRRLSDAIGGVVAVTDLHRISSRMMSGDMALTERQMLALEKAGVLYARAMKMSTTEGVDFAARALSTGRGLERLLRTIGSSVQLVGDDAHKAHTAIEELVRRTQDLAISAKNSSERATSFRSSISLATAEMVTAVKKSSEYKDALYGIGEASKTAASMLRVFTGQMIGANEAARLLEQIGMMIPGARGDFARAAGIVRQLGGEPGKRREPPITVYGPGGEMIFGLEEGLEIVGHANGPPRGGARRRTPEDVDPIWKLRAAQSAAWTSRWLARDESARRSDRRSADRDADTRRWLEGMEDARAIREQEEAHARKMRAWQEEHDRISELVAIYKEHDKQMREMTVGTIANFAAGIWAIADAAVSGGASFADGIKRALKATMLALASEATVKALMATAEGIFALASVVRAAQAPAYFAAAGKYAAVAAIAGAGGLAMSAAGWGGAGAASGAHAPSGGYRPSFGEARKPSELPPIVVRVTFDRSDPAAAEMARRRVRAELVAAGYDA